MFCNGFITRAAFALVIWLFIFCLHDQMAVAERTSTLILTQDEIAFLTEHPVIRVANELDWPPFDYFEFGRPKGMSIDFIKLLAQKAGIKIEFVNGYTWTELLALFQQGKIDVIPAIYKNRERETYMLFTPPYYKGKLGIFISTEDTTTQGANQLSGKKVGIQRDHGAIPLIHKLAPGAQLIEHNKTGNLVKNLATGQLDAIIGNPLLFYYLARENQITNIRLSGYVEMEKAQQAKTSLHVGVRKDLPQLFRILQKAMEKVSDDEMRTIESRWIDIFSQEKIHSRIPLTKEEKAFIAAHRVIRVSNDMDYPPFDFTIDNEPMGYSIDLLRLMVQPIGIELAFINGYSWDELMALFTQGELDLLHSVNRTTDREKIGLFTRPYKRNKNYFIIRKETSEIRDIRQLYGKTLAVGKGWSLEQYLLRQHPAVRLLSVKNTVSVLEAVSTGKAHAGVEAGAIASYIFLREGIRDLRLSGWFKEFDNVNNSRFHFMVQKNASPLVSILNKAYAAIDQGDLEKLENKWFGTAIKTMQPVALTKQEREFIRSHPEIVLGAGISFEPFLIKNEDGSISGHDAEIAELIMESTGLNIRFHLGNWKDVQEKARKRELDGLACTVIHPSRSQDYNFSSPYITLSGLLIVKTGNPKQIKNEKDISGKRVAVQKGNLIFESTVRKVAGIPIYVETIHDTLKTVASRNTDCTILDETAFYVARKLGISRLIEPAFPVGGQFDLVFSLRNDQPELVSIINKGLRGITEQERVEIRNRWFGDTGSDADRIKLTPEEQKYIDQKGVITMCVDPHWMPLERINKNREHEGMAADFMAMFAKRIGVNIKLIPTVSQAETVSFARNRKCDIVSLSRAMPTLKKYMDVTTPYISFPLVVATTNDKLFIPDITQELDKIFAVTKDNLIVSSTAMYADVNVLEVNNIFEGFEKLRRGEVFGYIDLSPAIAYAIQKQGTLDIKISGSFGEKKLNLGIATRNDEPLLKSVFQKAVTSLNETDKQRIYNQWFSVKFEKGVDYTLIWQVIMGALAVLAAILFWNRKLADARQQTQQALDDLHETQGRLKIKNQELEYLAVTDRLTGLYNRGKLDESLTREYDRTQRTHNPFSLIIMDIDHFKTVNDNHGHQAGDTVLMEMARILTRSIRKTDIVGRWGGEEFLVICPETDDQGAEKLAEKIRRAVADNPFHTIGSLTSSFGVATSRSNEAITNIIQRADQALYTAKSNGRNRVETGQ